jgi:DNA-binding NarL/FixJ family response regulator
MVTLRVLLCDDRPLVLDGLALLLSREPDMTVVGATGSAAQAAALAREHRPHVVISGSALRHPGGLEFVRRLQAEDLDPTPGIIMLTSLDSDESIDEALQAGACGLLAEDASQQELTLAIRVVSRGEAMLGSQAAGRLLQWFREARTPARRVDVPSGTILTRREQEILVLAAAGYSTEGIAGKLFISTTTVRTHLYRIQCKLQVKNRAQLVSLAFRAGLVDAA